MERPTQSLPPTPRAQALALPVLAGLVLMVSGALGAIYWQQQGQRSQMEGQLAQLSRVLNEPREGVAEVKARVDRARGLIPQDLKETEVYPIIRALAQENGVVVKTQSAGKETTSKVGDRTYRIFPFSVQVGGEKVTYQQVVNFITNLETQQRLPTLFIDKVTLTQSEGTASATIDLRVYALPEAKPAPQGKPTPTPKK